MSVCLLSLPENDDHSDQYLSSDNHQQEQRLGHNDERAEAIWESIRRAAMLQGEENDVLIAVESMYQNH